MKVNWKEIIGTVAPGIATALGGPLAGMAVTTLASALGVEANEKTIQSVITSSSPEILLKLKEAELQFQKDMRAADIDIERISASDRASARDLAIKTTLTPQVILASIFIIAFSMILYLVFTGEATIKEMMEPAMYLLGILSAGLGQIMNFFFGSSSGSKEKTSALAKGLK